MRWTSTSEKIAAVSSMIAILAAACSGDSGAARHAAEPTAGEGGMAAETTDEKGSGGAGDGAGGGAQAGETGAAQPAAPEITTVSLPDGSFNQDYAFALEARGGSGESYVWRLASGALPAGLELSASGMISGVPLEGGSFDFEVTAADSNDMTDSVDLSLKVARSRWFVYVNGLELRAVDLTSETLENITITPSVPQIASGIYGSIPYVSPNGRFATYSFILQGEWSTTEVHLVDLDANPPRDVVATELSEQLFYGYAAQWSPDSRTLGLIGIFENARGELLAPAYATYLDAERVLSSPREPANFERIATAFSTVEWVSPDTLVYPHLLGEDENGNTIDQLSYSVRDGDTFSEPQAITNEGQTYDQNTALYYIDPPSGRAILGPYSQAHCLTMDLFDVAKGVTDFGDDPLLPAPGLDLFAGTLDSTLRVIDSDQQSIATLGLTECDLIQWSESGNLLGWLSTDDQQYQVTRITSDRQNVETFAVPNGSYTMTAERPTFSPDDGWLAYRADGNLFVARIEADGVASAVRVNSELAAPETERVNAFHFAPNGKALVYGAAEQVPGINELFFVDLSSGTPAAPRRISPDLSGFPAADTVSLDAGYDMPEYLERTVHRTPWTPDSSKVLFVVSDPSYEVGDTLYVVDVLAPEPIPVQVDAAICDVSDFCAHISPVGINSYQAPR
jgi:hypothetical protein